MTAAFIILGVAIFIHALCILNLISQHEQLRQEVAEIKALFDAHKEAP